MTVSPAQSLLSDHPKNQFCKQTHDVVAGLRGVASLWFVKPLYQQMWWDQFLRLLYKPWWMWIFPRIWLAQLLQAALGASMHMLQTLWQPSSLQQDRWECTVLTPWEASRFSADQEASCIPVEARISLLHSQVPAPIPVLSHINSDCPPPHHPTCWRSILILSFHECLGLPSSLISSGFPTKPCMHLSTYICATCPVHLVLLDFVTHILFDEEYKS